ncbi:MAG: CehA/McbA family metallohydrolase [Thalassotalea sp.]
MKFLKKSLIKLIVLLALSCLIISISPNIEKNGKLSPAEIHNAKNILQELRQKFASTNNFIEISLSQNELDSIAIASAHTIPKSRFQTRLSHFGLYLFATKEFSILGAPLYINISCLLTPDFDKFSITSCDLGYLPINGWLVEKTIGLTTGLIFGDDAEETVMKLIYSGQIKNNQLILTTTKTTDFKDQINSTMKNAASVIRTINNNSADIETERVKAYLSFIHSLPQTESSLAWYIGKVFAFAQKQSIEYDPVTENTAALWALAIAYSNNSFARFIGIENTITINNAPTLRGRGDLKLHFLYSVVLEQIGDQEIALNIGEIKELLDSYKGGSGYSFADLAADKTGLMFSEKLTKSTTDAIFAQKTLANITDESVFFPFIHDLPEGFKGNEFERVFDNIDSPLYRSQENRIVSRINRMPLFKEKKHSADNNNKISRSTATPVKNGQWLTIDTHIHTKYSDGNQTVAQLAKQASTYGCNAIAITDHGDYNLNKVATPEYFNDIAKVNESYPYMTIMAGLEWNIPPFMGREHATVLLPKHENSQRDLYAFKTRYDSWGKRDQKLLDAEQALKWLEKNATYNDIAPVVIYNHPSRKDYQHSENKHDIEEWSSYSDMVIGFSGAPGHQKNRAGNNGSYTHKQKTIHGWDPSIAITGAEWDLLLQEGKNVWAARAASDFHGSSGDFWPCQFSTTHLYSKNNDQNNILQALRAGNFWAQHGKFIDQLAFTVKNNKNSATMGDNLNVDNYTQVTITLDLTLNERDWQNYSTSLDEIELIVITEDDIRTVKFEPLMYEKSPLKFHFEKKLLINTQDTVLRWRGRSIQAEDHHYMFYTNPIRLTSK